MKVAGPSGWIVVPVAIVALAFVTASVAPRSSEVPAEWLHYGNVAGATFLGLPSTRQTARPYTLELVGILPTVEAAVFACASADTHRLELFATRSVRSNEREWLSSVLRWWPASDARAETLLSGRLMCPFRAHAADSLRLLAVHAELEYEPARGAIRVEPTHLFIRNLIAEARIGRRQRITRALRNAFEGDSLSVVNELLLLSPKGAVVRRIGLGDLLKVESSEGAVALTRGGPVILISSSGDEGQDSGVIDLLIHQEHVGATTVTSDSGAREARGSLRGMVAVDFESGQRLWHSQQGVVVRLHAFDDLNGDGLTEIVVGSYSPFHVVSGGGTRDALCGYVMCLDESGNELWRHRFTGPCLGTQVAVADLLGDSAVEVVAMAKGGASDEVGEAFILSHDGEVLANTSEFGGMFGLVIADISSDGAADIAVGGSQGRVLLLDASLDTVACYRDTAHQRYESKRLVHLAAADLDGDGDLELAALSVGWTTHSFRSVGSSRSFDPLSYVVILGPELREKARARIPVLSGVGPLTVAGGSDPSNSMIVDLDMDGASEVVLVAPNRGTFVYRLVPEGGE